MSYSTIKYTLYTLETNRGNVWLSKPTRETGKWQKLKLPAANNSLNLPYVHASRCCFTKCTIHFQNVPLVQHITSVRRPIIISVKPASLTSWLCGQVYRFGRSRSCCCWVVWRTRCYLIQLFVVQLTPLLDLFSFTTLTHSPLIFSFKYLHCAHCLLAGHTQPSVSCRGIRSQQSILAQRHWHNIQKVLLLR